MNKTKNHIYIYYFSYLIIYIFYSIFIVFVLFIYTHFKLFIHLFLNIIYYKIYNCTEDTKINYVVNNNDF